MGCRLLTEVRDVQWGDVIILCGSADGEYKELEGA